MSIVALFLLLALIGLFVWLLTAFIPMPQQFKTLLIVVAIIIALLIVLQAFGLLSGIGSVAVPRVR